MKTYLMPQLCIRHNVTTAQEYYDIILRSKKNGNLKQVIVLYKQMKYNDRVEFLSYCLDCLHHPHIGSYPAQLYYEVLKALIEI